MSGAADLFIRCLIALCVSEGAVGAHAAPHRAATAARLLSPPPLDIRRDSAAAALASIVGVWQSDTVAGTSARSKYLWTPGGSAVLCEQRISSPAGPHTALNLFTVRPAGRGYELYVVGRPGDRAHQVHLAIRGPIWTYGDSAADRHGRSEITINDFSPKGSYVWKEEVRPNGGSWRVVAHGVSRLVRGQY